MRDIVELYRNGKQTETDCDKNIATATCFTVENRYICATIFRKVPMDKSSPIAVFDSGMGGLTVLSRIIRLMPCENTVYYADSAHCPYGPRPAEQVRELVARAVDVLTGMEAKIVVLACNTASVAAVDYLRARYPVDFVAMEPAVKPAVLTTRTGVVGVLATRGTVDGAALARLRRTWSQAEVVALAGEGLVEIVESDTEDSDEARRLAELYTGQLLDKGADRIVLGCTHYPFLRPQIERAIGGRATVIDPAPAVARRVESLLRERGLLNDGAREGSRLFLSSLGDDYNRRLEKKLENYMRIDDTER